ncbi:MAG: hypothetical protein LLG45_03510, partial [Actinomycetia bacterium]|nr:hypothetical protein [Actinomycetes bacterium]
MLADVLVVGREARDLGSGFLALLAAMECHNAATPVAAMPVLPSALKGISAVSCYRPGFVGRGLQSERLP